MGQSCGGLLLIKLGADPRVDTIGVFNSGRRGTTSPGSPRSRSVLFINGHERDFLMASSKATFDAIDKLPAFYGARQAPATPRPSIIPVAVSGRTSPPTGCDWQFKGDERAAQMFAGQGLQPSARTRTGIPVEAFAVIKFSFFF